MNNNISFGANFIKSVPIKKYIPDKKLYTETSANFVELSPFDKKDVLALKEIAYEFGDDSYANNIYFNAQFAFKRNNINSEDMGVFALTEQNDKYEFLDARKVLGLAEVSKKEHFNAELEYLQVNPQFLNKLDKPEFKHIGTAILDCLKEFYNSIKLNSSPNAKSFYIRNEFIETNPETRTYFWKKV